MNNFLPKQLVKLIGFFHPMVPPQLSSTLLYFLLVPGNSFFTANSNAPVNLAVIAISGNAVLSFSGFTYAPLEP